VQVRLSKQAWWAWLRAFLAKCCFWWKSTVQKSLLGLVQSYHLSPEYLPSWLKPSPQRLSLNSYCECTLALKLHVHSVNFIAKRVNTRDVGLTTTVRMWVVGVWCMNSVAAYKGTSPLYLRPHIMYSYSYGRPYRYAISNKFKSSVSLLLQRAGRPMCKGCVSKEPAVKAVKAVSCKGCYCKEPAVKAVKAVSCKGCYCKEPAVKDVKAVSC